MGECGGRVDIPVFFSHISLSFFMLLSQPVFTRKSDPLPAGRGVCACVCTRALVCGFNAATLNALKGQGAFPATCCVVCNV